MLMGDVGLVTLIVANLPAFIIWYWYYFFVCND